MRACAVIPAYEAERHVGEVVRATAALWPVPGAVFVVDDGSHDRTAEVARAAGATVLRHPLNRGKGAALRTGMEHALRVGFEVAVTLDADGQHPPAEAARLLAVPDVEALVLGLRDLRRAGAPRANQISNGISDFFLSLFAGRTLRDTQCGLRRYPLRRTLSLGVRDEGYAFEAEVILRSIAGQVPIVEVPIEVIYPPENERLTHFDSVRDPARIVVRVVETLALTRGLRRVPASEAPAAQPVRKAPSAPAAASTTEAAPGDDVRPLVEVEATPLPVSRPVVPPPP
ncbi:glycosyltransferase family 2 protein [Chondromyces crocatus]|uniref:Glycosyltransferase n=1 Tax=Chondromyces crocatus TaxID=52 RepID=A0A0K1E8M8_CHOCO|nr:glycosyltransferase family 2 protein [Chondromyces crocatus]AKT37231.1 glycosyltransferase [Chondromyces crocatus]